MLDAADSTPVRIIPYGVGGQLGTLPDGIGGHTPPQALRFPRNPTFETPWL